ncbi:1831_t:CDS:2 [Entrophospora sp. SA101]|nr:1831_t:CDS:2 [Entrophospora sp. SA101]
MSRLIKDSIMLNEDLAIGSDKCGNVFGLLYNEAEIVSRLRVVYLGYRSDNITYSTTSLSSSAAVIGCSLLGSVFLFVRVNLKSYKLLRVLQTILEKWPTTRPVLGNDNSKFRSDHNATKLNFVIDGEMVSQFLRLSKQEQFRIIEKHPELIKAGKIFIHGENWFYGKSEEVIMAKYVTNVEEKKEVGNDLMDEEEIDEMNYIGETIKQVYTHPSWCLARYAPSTTKITLLEASNRFGGWIESKRVGNHQILFEQGPRTIRPAGIGGLLILDMVYI